MEFGQLLVVIIETPGSTRSQPLIRSLESDHRFNVVRLSACMLSTYSEVENLDTPVNLETFKFLQGRIMSPQEIGCAVSHNLARGLLASSAIGGVILEDDARIQNFDSFFESASKFLYEQLGKISILSLNEFSSKDTSNFERKGFQRLFGKPFLALAYAATPKAATALQHANQPLGTVADWPTARVTFFSVFKPLVLHGDTSSGSTIDIHGSLDRKGLKTIHKFYQLLFISFFHKPKNLSLSQYINEVHWSRISWRLDMTIRHFLRVVSR